MSFLKSPMSSFFRMLTVTVGSLLIVNVWALPPERCDPATMGCGPSGTLGIPLGVPSPPPLPSHEERRDINRPVWAVTTERGTDRPGADYRSFEVTRRGQDTSLQTDRINALNSCRDACLRDRKCQAYTVSQTRMRGQACWLKNQQPAPTKNGAFISGVKFDRRD
jgi:PAN domain